MIVAKKINQTTPPTLQLHDYEEIILNSRLQIPAGQHFFFHFL